MYKKNFIITILTFSVYICAQADIEIRYLKPPRLEEENILKHVVCHRPMRLEKPRIEQEQYNNKIIIHNYGHASGGWTMGPGSAQYAVNLLPEIPYDTPITVIGAGVIGLFTAYQLIKTGYTNITLIAESFDNLTSHKAGGLFAYMSTNPDDNIRNFINNLAIESYKVYATIAEHKHPDFSAGARYLPAYFTSRESSDLEAYVGIVMRPARDVTVDFQNGTQRQMVVYDDGIFMDTIKLIQELHIFLHSKQVTFIQQHVTSFDSVDSDIIFNCSALGAKSLASNDSGAIYPAQGHLLMLKNQDPSELQYMIELVLNRGITHDGFEICRCCYFFPKQLADAKADEIGVLGGTFIKYADNTTPHLEEFDTVLANARKFFTEPND